MDFVTDQLAISDAQTVRRLNPEHHEFDEVVTLGYLDTVGYERPAASTTGDRFVFPDGDHEYAKFEVAVEYVVTALADDDTVLVHCQAGVSRSAAVVSTTLATVRDISLQEAFRRVRAVRTTVNPHPKLQDSMERYTGDRFTYEPAAYDEYPDS